MSQIHVIVLFLIALLLSCSCDATNKTEFVNTEKSKLKILAIFGHLGRSHFQVFKPLIEELARRGHEITVISHFPRTDSAKAKEPLPTYKDISLLDPNVGVFVNIVDLQTTLHHTIMTFVKNILMLRYMADNACRICLESQAIKEFLQSDAEFDVILTENFNTDCFLGFVHRFKAPYLSLSSHEVMPWVTDVMGDEDNPSYIPIILVGRVRPLNFIGRLENTLAALISKACYEYLFRSRDQVFANQLFGPDLPNLKEISKQNQAVLVNTHSSLQGSRPHLPNIVEIGGLHIPPRINPLPQDIAEFLDNAHDGVLYFNLGSMIKASSMPQEKLDMILNVIGSIPRKVIWKWEADELPRKLDNVMIKKWLPQFDVMNHPNVKCYLGHGGLLGLSEGVYVGLPMILIPIYGDQFYNSASAQTRGFAVVISYNDLNEHTLRHALDEVFNNTNYRENAQRVSKAYRDRPATPLETAIWWTEYVARGNGRPYLRSDSADLPGYKRYLIDVALVLIIVCAALIYILFRFIKLLLSLLRAVKGMLGSAGKKKKKE